MSQSLSADVQLSHHLLVGGRFVRMEWVRHGQRTPLPMRRLTWKRTGTTRNSIERAPFDTDSGWRF